MNERSAFDNTFLSAGDGWEWFLSLPTFTKASFSHYLQEVSCTRREVDHIKWSKSTIAHMIPFRLLGVICVNSHFLPLSSYPKLFCLPGLFCKLLLLDLGMCRVVFMFPTTNNPFPLSFFAFYHTSFQDPLELIQEGLLIIKDILGYLSDPILCIMRDSPSLRNSPQFMSSVIHPCSLTLRTVAFGIQ